jgi:hypothetical protein
MYVAISQSEKSKVLKEGYKATLRPYVPAAKSPENSLEAYKRYPKHALPAVALRVAAALPYTVDKRGEGFAINTKHLPAQYLSEMLDPDAALEEKVKRLRFNQSDHDQYTSVVNSIKSLLSNNLPKHLKVDSCMSLHAPVPARADESSYTHKLCRDPRRMLCSAVVSGGRRVCVVKPTSTSLS